MPFLIKPRPVVSQPNSGLSIAKPFQKGLLGVFHAPLISQDWVSAGTVLKAPSTIGYCFESSGVGSRYDKTVSENQNTGFTMFAHFVVRVTTAQDYVGIYNGGTYQSLFYVGGTTRIFFYPKNGTAVQAHSKVLAVGDIVTICGSADGASYNIATTINGSTEIVTGSYTGTSAYNNIYVGAKFISTGSHRTALASFWKRALPLEEVRALATNPWNLFEAPKRKLYFAGSAPGTITGTFNTTENTVDTFSSSGDVFISGTFNTTEGTVDIFAASGNTNDAVTGSLNATESTVDVFASSGTILVSGSLTATESTSDTLSISGTVLVEGSLAATEGTSDVFFATNVAPAANKTVNSKWLVSLGSTGGTVQLQMASEVNGVDVTLQDGLLFLKYRKI